MWLGQVLCRPQGTMWLGSGHCLSPDGPAVEARLSLMQSAPSTLPWVKKGAPGSAKLYPQLKFTRWPGIEDLRENPSGPLTGWKTTPMGLNLGFLLISSSLGFAMRMYEVTRERTQPSAGPTGGTQQMPLLAYANISSAERVPGPC